MVISTTSGDTDWNLAYNNTKTEVTRSGDNIDGDRKRQIEETTPDTRWNLSANHNVGSLRLLGRISYYSKWWDDEDKKLFNGEYVMDIEASYDIDDQSSVLIGGSNIFNNSGGNSSKTGALGRQYSQFAPMGFNGAFWYATYRYNF